ncbi:WD40 repeat-like protein [Rhizodiscina lignyota]|uniref:WD40 repeat-like protein n=1 Tax=Rhizodiscina lignyota TaxID=1504668 RepID=A0A9P4M544_9PEZI|nr:WD40 repeat-like protein [Rhizodiscina lignyota]
MNLSLSDSSFFLKDRPEVLVGRLRSGHSTVIKFSHRGDFLASGRLDGTVVVFDVETSGVARKLRGHTRQVQSLSWSSDDRYLLTASHDWKCILWDLQDGSRLRTVRFEAPVFIAELHPKNHFLFVIALFEDQPQLVDVSSETPLKRTTPSTPKRSQADKESGGEKQAAQDAKNTTTVATFTSNGDHILSGTNKGWLNVIDTATCKTFYSTHLTNSIVIYIRLNGKGETILVNSSDRCVRTIKLPNFSSDGFDWDNLRLEVEHKFQDQINRQSWNHACFSPADGEYAAMTSYMNHIIYLWERAEKGSLVAVLEGPKEELSVVEWHPNKTFVAAIGVDSGRIYLWATPTPQRWSALAPDFVEVEENVEYVEREDEFDIHPIEEVHKRRLDAEDEEVDVLTTEPAKAESVDGQFRMPVLLDIEASDSEDEMIAIGAGQFRRKSPGAGRDWGDEGSNAPSGDERKVNGAVRGTNGNKRRRAE